VHWLTKLAGSRQRQRRRNRDARDVSRSGPLCCSRRGGGGAHAARHRAEAMVEQPSRLPEIDGLGARWAWCIARRFGGGSAAGSRRPAVPALQPGRSTRLPLASTTSAGPAQAALPAADPRDGAGERFRATRLPSKSRMGLGPCPLAGEADGGGADSFPGSGPGSTSSTSSHSTTRLRTFCPSPSGPWPKRLAMGPLERPRRRAAPQPGANGRVSSLAASRNPNMKLGPGGRDSLFQNQRGGPLPHARANQRRIEGFTHQPPRAAALVGQARCQ